MPSTHFRLGISLTLVVISEASGTNFSTVSRTHQKSLLSRSRLFLAVTKIYVLCYSCTKFLPKIEWNIVVRINIQIHLYLFLKNECIKRTFETMPEDVFQYNKELLQRYVVVVQHTSVGQAGVYHLLDDQLRHIQQVTALYGLGISSWNN